jgi:hypothetical protein
MGRSQVCGLSFLKAVGSCPRNRMGTPAPTAFAELIEYELDSFVPPPALDVMLDGRRMRLFE